MSRADYGTVEVEIDGDTYTLAPTLKAMQKIQNRWKAAGGIQGAIQACQGMDPSDLAFIVVAGAGLGQRVAKELEEPIFQDGVAAIAAPLVEYLVLLINPTGREAAGDAEPGE